MSSDKFFTVICCVSSWSYLTKIKIYVSEIYYTGKQSKIEKQSYKLLITRNYLTLCTFSFEIKKKSSLSDDKVPDTKCCNTTPNVFHTILRYKFITSWGSVAWLTINSLKHIILKTRYKV